MVFFLNFFLLLFLLVLFLSLLKNGTILQLSIYNLFNNNNSTRGVYVCVFCI